MLRPSTAGATSLTVIPHHVASLAEDFAARAQAVALAAPRILDFSACHGEFGLAMARANANATVDALDSAPALAVARERVAAEGLSERFRFLEGSPLEFSFDGPYDVALFANVLRHVDRATAERFLAKVRRALVPGGKALTVDDVYTAAQLRALFRAAGFATVTLEQSSTQPFTVVVAEA